MSKDNKEENTTESTNPREMGRPLKYRDLKQLQGMIDDYFNSCFEWKWIDEEVRDEETGLVVIGENGKPKKRPVKKRVQIEPITITGLAVALDTSRKTLVEYEKREDKVPDISNAIKKAKDFCEHCVERGMFNGDIPPVVGIFNLKANYKWQDKIEIDLNDGRRSAEDIAKSLKKIAEE